MSGCGCGAAAAAPAGSACGCGGACGGSTRTARHESRPPVLPARPARDQSPARSQRLSSARTAWCGTGAKDDGKLLAGSHHIPQPVPAGTSLRLTPFGAFAVEAGKANLLAVFEVADRYRVRCRQGDTGLLRAGGPGVLRPDPATSLQPGGSVFVGARTRAPNRAVPRAQWEQVPPTVRAAARAQGFRPEAGGAVQTQPGATVRGGTAVNPVTPARGYNQLDLPDDIDLLAADVAHTFDERPPAVPAGLLDDPCACSGTYECTIVNKVIVDYVGYRLCVPERWFWNHVEDDDWMSPTDTMEDLWRAVHNTGTGMSDSVFDDLIGCWMIDTAHDSHGRSYSMFFDGDAPREFLKYALDLVRRFSDEIKDEWSGTTTCAGLRGYIEDVLDGKQGSTLTERVGPCTIEIRAVSSRTWMASQFVSRSCGDQSEPRVDCAHYAGDEADTLDIDLEFGAAFDDWSQVLDYSSTEPTGGPIYQVMVRSAYGSNRTTPGAIWLGYAITISGSMAFAANRLAFCGYRFDFTMFYARVALQYAYERGDWDAWYGSWVYTRAAMAYLLEYGRVFIHEAGHLHMGRGGHCLAAFDRKSLVPACCFDIAAEHWKCRVGSRLGLPDLGSLQCGADPSFLTFSNPCGGEGATYPMACDRVALCSIEAASFYALPCS